MGNSEVILISPVAVTLLAPSTLKVLGAYFIVRCSEYSF